MRSFPKVRCEKAETCPVPAPPERGTYGVYPAVFCTHKNPHYETCSCGYCLLHAPALCVTVREEP